MVVLTSCQSDNTRDSCLCESSFKPQREEWVSHQGDLLSLVHPCHFFPVITATTSTTTSTTFTTTSHRQLKSTACGARIGSGRKLLVLLLTAN